MTRAAILPFSKDPIANKNFATIAEVLNGRITLDNLANQVISGTTASTPDTQSLHNHSMTPMPSGAIPLVGDVYIQEISEQYVDVRSTKPGVNFKIILIGGGSDSQSVPVPALTAVGNDDYLDTLDQIPTVDVPITGLGDFQDALLGENPGIDTTLGHSYLDCVTDGTYFYITNIGATVDLVRVNRDTGVTDSLTCGAVQLSAMYLSGTTLYVGARASSGTNYSVFEVNTATFTLTATHTATAASGLQEVTELYTNGSNFYMTSTTSTNNSRIGKFAVGGGAMTLTTLDTGSNAALGLLAHSNGFIYVSENDTSIAAARIFKINMSTLAVDTTYTTTDGRWLVGKMVQYGNYILIPGHFSTTKSATSADYTYGSVLIVLDTTGGTFTYTGIMTGGANPNNFHTNAVLDSANDYLYLASSLGSQSGRPIVVVQCDLLTGSQRAKWYPLTTTPSANGFNNLIVKDTDGTPILISDPGSSGGSFIWMPVTFDEQTEQNFGSFI